MFRTVVLAPDLEFGKAVERLAFESRHLTVNKTVSTFPENGYDVGRVISSYSPEIVLVENTSLEVTLKVSEKLRAYAPDVAVLALGGHVAIDVEKKFEAIGATLLNGAFSPHQFLGAIQDAIHRARQKSIGPALCISAGQGGKRCDDRSFQSGNVYFERARKKNLCAGGRSALRSDVHVYGQKAQAAANRRITELR